MDGSTSREAKSSLAPPRQLRTGIIIVVVVAVFLAGLGGGYYLSKAGSSSPTPGTVSGLPVPSTIQEIQGWYRNGSVTYLNFGANSNITAPILVITEGGNAVPGQYNIIDTLPGEPGYSSFWRVYTVAVPSGYVVNSIRSLQDVLNGGYSFTETTTVVNCPVVNPGTMIQGQTAPLVQGWYRGETVYYWGGETNSTAYGSVVRTNPIYVLQYANGTPVPNQRHIVDTIPMQPGYSDLWQVANVTVGASYVANTYESAFAVLMAAGDGNATIALTPTLVNCPIVG